MIRILGVIFTKRQVMSNSYKQVLWIWFMLPFFNPFIRFVKCLSVSFCAKCVFERYFPWCFDSWCFCCRVFRQVPVTGKVVEVLENEFGIHYSKGSHACKILRTALVKYSRITVLWTDVLPKHSIIVCYFHFDNQSKLSKIHWAI